MSDLRCAGSVAQSVCRILLSCQRSNLELSMKSGVCAKRHVF